MSDDGFRRVALLKHPANPTLASGDDKSALSPKVSMASHATKAGVRAIALLDSELVEKVVALAGSPRPRRSACRYWTE